MIAQMGSAVSGGVCRVITPPMPVYVTEFADTSVGAVQYRIVDPEPKISISQTSAYPSFAEMAVIMAADKDLTAIREPLGKSLSVHRCIRLVLH